MFFWIHFYNFPCGGFVAFNLHVSILVFLDSLLQHSKIVVLTSSPDLFQSLFFWIHFYNNAERNPQTYEDIVFQSLFFWIHFYNQAKIRYVECVNEFQSLFFWIHFYNDTDREADNHPAMFQSLFFWIHFYNAAH